MSYEHGTPFLNLAQTVGTDHRDWFDENEAKLDLDTKMKTLWDGAADIATILATLQENVASLQTDVTTLEGVVSGHTSTITTINESLVLINTALNALNTQVTNKFDSAGIADPYDSSYGVYAVGDVVTYNGQRYVCSTAVTAAEPFDVSKWTAEDVQTKLNEIDYKADKVELVASGTSGQTYGQQLNSLLSVFSTLSPERKSRSFIEFNDVIFPFAGAARYSGMQLSLDGATLTSLEVNTSLALVESVNITSGQWTLTNNSNNALNYSMHLYA